MLAIAINTSMGLIKHRHYLLFSEPDVKYRIFMVDVIPWFLSLQIL
jgi:hypothetical protein